MIARDAVGVGLRVPHYKAVLEADVQVDFFEAISENYLGEAEPPRRVLEQIRRRYPIVLHGVGLNLLGHAPLDEHYLELLARLADALDAPYVTDHLCWTGAHGVTHHDLLPVPYTPELLEMAAERASFVQKRLDRPFGLENLSSYVEFESSTLTEWEFYAGVVREARCYSLFDVNNVYVSSQNHGFDPELYLAAIDYTRVLEVHLAGHEVTSDRGIIDTHDREITPAVWELYRKAWQMGGPFPTLIEWDDKVPSLSALLSEADKARQIRT